MILLILAFSGGAWIFYIIIMSFSRDSCKFSISIWILKCVCFELLSMLKTYFEIWLSVFKIYCQARESPQTCLGILTEVLIPDRLSVAVIVCP